jgi:hypothetical protein
MSPIANNQKWLRLGPGLIGGTIDGTHGSIMAQMWTRRAELPRSIPRLGLSRHSLSNYAFDKLPPSVGIRPEQLSCAGANGLLMSIRSDHLKELCAQ